MSKFTLNHTFAPRYEDNEGPRSWKLSDRLSFSRPSATMTDTYGIMTAAARTKCSYNNT